MNNTGDFYLKDSGKGGEWTHIIDRNGIVNIIPSRPGTREEIWQSCACPTTEIIKQGFTGGEFVGWLAIAVAISLSIGFLVGLWRGDSWVRAEAVQRKLGDYAVDTDTGKIKFWWTGKPGRK